jgi:sodium-dependent dicarboxylate transporter 2/3/5
MMQIDAPDDLTHFAWATAAIGLLMAVWWATEAVPIAVTALLPIVLFPMFGIATIQDTVPPYANKVIFLFLGGFIVAFAMQRWNLHRRMALAVLQHAGGNGRSLVGGFMLASALISMWVMNTSTTMMLLPIAVSIITVIPERHVRGIHARKLRHRYSIFKMDDDRPAAVCNDATALLDCINPMDIQGRLHHLRRGPR